MSSLTSCPVDAGKEAVFTPVWMENKKPPGGQRNSKEMQNTKYQRQTSRSPKVLDTVRQDKQRIHIRPGRLRPTS